MTGKDPPLSPRLFPEKATLSPEKKNAAKKKAREGLSQLSIIVEGYFEGTVLNDTRATM